jgi:hypothetical protein
MAGRIDALRRAAGIKPTGVICVAWQQLSVGKHRASEIVHLRDGLLQVWHHDELLKIIARGNTKEVRKKRAATTRQPHDN